MTTRVEHVMGMAVSIDVRDQEGPVADAAVRSVIDWLHWVDATFSTYKVDSEVSRIARGEIEPEQAVVPVQYVLARCESLCAITDGYFDAWAGGACDPSGLVKGWSVEVASAMLADAGVPNHAINAGGDIRLRGHPSPAEPWRVGIAHPLEPGVLCAVVELGGDAGAIATSGPAERGAHVVDPHTGRSALDLASVTVTGADLGQADALATAALAMGLDAPDWLDGLQGYEGMCVDAGGHIRATAGFPSSTSAAPLPRGVADRR